MGDSTSMARRSPTRDDLRTANRLLPVAMPSGCPAGMGLRIVPTSSPVTSCLIGRLWRLHGLLIDQVLTLRSGIRVLLLKRFRILLRSVVHGITDAGLRS